MADELKSLLNRGNVPQQFEAGIEKIAIDGAGAAADLGRIAMAERMWGAAATWFETAIEYLPASATNLRMAYEALRDEALEKQRNVSSNGPRSCLCLMSPIIAGARRREE